MKTLISYSIPDRDTDVHLMLNIDNNRVCEGHGGSNLVSSGSEVLVGNWSTHGSLPGVNRG